MFENFFKTTLRNLWKNRTYSFLNIFGLAIGIACAGLIFLWAEDEMTFDNVNVKKDRLYSVQINITYNGGMFTMGSTPRPMGASVKAEIPGIVNAARVSIEGDHSLFSFENKSLYASGKYVDSSLFSMLTLPFVEGDAKNAFAQLYSIVLTEKAAKKFFGEEKKVVGKTVRVDNKQDYVVTGVLKDLPENSTLQFEWLAPYQIATTEVFAKLGNNSDEFRWDSYGPFTYIELDSKANLIAINNQLKDYIHRKDPKEKSTAFLFPMSAWRLYDEFENGKQTGSGRIKQVRTLSAIAWIILFIACINFMNLATANSQKRAREVGVRKVLGAGKKGLIMQFIGEALFMSLLASVAAIIIIILALPSPRGNPDGVFTNTTVIGVVKDYVYGNIYGKASPLMIFCKPPEFQNFIYVRIKPQNNVEQALAKIEEVMKKNNPAYPLEYKFVDEQFDKMIRNETLISKVSTVFAALAIIISCLGLFGLAAYTAEQRTKEIGIRKVLGASVAGLASLLSKDFLQLVCISFLIAFPLAWWIMHDWLQGYEYRIAISWWIFLIAGAMAILIALFTISFQAIRAALANPVKSLRSE